MTSTLLVLLRLSLAGWGGRPGEGGTLLFPESMGTLKPGAFASVGLGVDNAR